MDINANYRDQKILAEAILEGSTNIEDAYRLAELVESMHEWIDKGGFLPEIWEANRPKMTREAINRGS